MQKNSCYWYCPKCKEELDGCHVTYQELCEYCGTAVLSVAESISQERLKELISAEADGRLVVLPCKVGDELWVIRYGEIRRNYAYQWHLMNSPEQCFLSMYDDHCGLLDFGKTVFLTREAAEKALGGKEE